ncbi:hypothetical protein [Sphingomonas sp. S2-65]|uniref:hypothetical protein n=1 Tax=Sphingomonas sp. S2-65 TaxID=2903960 RepID=UPI001F1A3EBF|nr:hypothetical protein [Sphingomonas sp. S2-65]UYY60123.1 hypothetical protein LZ586_08615 [Sphingomonas sp. S2-65]
MQTNRFDAPVSCGSCGATTEGRMEHRFLEEPARVLDKTQVMELARAIRSGDIAEAEMQLDRVFRDEPLIREWIDQARAAKQ